MILTFSTCFTCEEKKNAIQNFPSNFQKHFYMNVRVNKGLHSCNYLVGQNILKSPAQKEINFAVFFYIFHFYRKQVFKIDFTSFFGLEFLKVSGPMWIQTLFFYIVQKKCSSFSSFFCSKKNKYYAITNYVQQFTWIFLKPRHPHLRQLNFLNTRSKTSNHFQSSRRCNT